MNRYKGETYTPIEPPFITDPTNPRHSSNTSPRGGTDLLAIRAVLVGRGSATNNINDVVYEISEKPRETWIASVYTITGGKHSSLVVEASWVINDARSMFYNVVPLFLFRGIFRLAIFAFAYRLII